MMHLMRKASHRQGLTLTPSGSILVPVDFSAESLRALRFADALARKYQMQLCLLHVTPILMGGRFLPNTPLIKSAASMLQKLAKKSRLPPSRVQVHVREGDPSDQICRFVQKKKTSLILLSSHGYTGWKRAMLGSTAGRIIRQAACPVLVLGPHVPSVSSSTAEKLFQNILAPVDFSRATGAMLNFVENNPILGKKPVHLVHVVELPLYAPKPGGDLEAVHDQMHRLATRHIQKTAETLHARGVRSTTKITTGDAWMEILREARVSKSSLILISTHGYNRLKYILLGSTTTKILQGATCPVLVYPQTS